MCLPYALAHPLIFPCAVECHLPELQLSKHKGYLNAFAEATPSISSYFHQREVLGVQMANIECFRHTLHVAWQLKTLYGQGGLLNKDKASVKVNCWVQLAYHMCPASGNGNRVTTYSCASTCYIYIHSVQKFTFRLVQSGHVSHTTDNSTSAAWHYHCSSLRDPCTVSVT